MFNHFRLILVVFKALGIICGGNTNAPRTLLLAIPQDKQARQKAIFDRLYVIKDLSSNRSWVIFITLTNTP